MKYQLPTPAMKTEPNQLTSLLIKNSISPTKKIIVLGLILLVSGMIFWAVKSKTTSKEATGVMAFELAPADIAVIAKRELQVNLPISGSLIPQNNIAVKAKVSAVVSETLVREGMAVGQGDVLARLETADLLARLATQDAAVEESATRLALAKKNRDASYALFQQKYISQNAFDTAENAVELAQANLKSTQSLRQVAQLALTDAVVRSPIQGIISKRLVQPGEKVSPDTPLFTLVNLDRLTLEAQVPASEIPRIKIGQTVKFAVDGFGGREFVGSVVRINPNAETGTRSFVVYIEVINHQGALRGGMFAKGQLTLEKTAQVNVIPLIAVHLIDGVATVYKVASNNMIVAQKVQLGLRNEDEAYAEVRQGLQTDDVVIVSQLDMVKPGSLIKMPLAMTPATKKE